MFTRNRVVAYLCIFAAGLMSFMMVPGAHAGVWHQKTQITVNAPVEIPGRVLSAGTYTLRLVDVRSGNSVVAIQNANTGKLITYALVQRVFRPTVTGKTVITEQERPSSAPPALLKWFYPGNEWGQEFIYSHAATRPMAALAHKADTAKG